MTIAQIKALFQTGKIPTQADFENLISKIPNDDLTGGGDSTLRLYNPSAPYVWGYRFVTLDDNYTYIFLGIYDASNGEIIPYIIFFVDGGRPLDGGAKYSYAMLDDNHLMEMYLNMGADMHNVDDNTLVNAIPSDLIWIPIGAYDKFTDTRYYDDNGWKQMLIFDVVKYQTNTSGILALPYKVTRISFSGTTGANDKLNSVNIYMPNENIDVRTVANAYKSSKNWSYDYILDNLVDMYFTIKN